MQVNVAPVSRTNVYGPLPLIFTGRVSRHRWVRPVRIESHLVLFQWAHRSPWLQEESRLQREKPPKRGEDTFLVSSLHLALSMFTGIGFWLCSDKMEILRRVKRREKSLKWFLYFVGSGPYPKAWESETNNSRLYRQNSLRPGNPVRSRSRLE
jgi:hypothetical protein